MDQATNAVFGEKRYILVLEVVNLRCLLKTPVEMYSRQLDL